MVDITHGGVALVELVGRGVDGLFQVKKIDFNLGQIAKGDIGERGAENGIHIGGRRLVEPGAGGHDDDAIEFLDQLLNGLANCDLWTHCLF